MTENPAFYATAAQVIPVLLVVTVLEERLRPESDPLELWGILRLLAAGLFTFAELIALASLGDREYTELRTMFIFLTTAVGLFLVIAAVAPPRRDSANYKPLLDRYQFDHPERARAIIVGTLMTPLVIVTFATVI